MHTLSVIGCGGAGEKFLDYIPKMAGVQRISLNISKADVIVDPDRMESYENVPSNLILSQFPWIQKIDSEDIFLIAGLGGKTGSEVGRILGKILGKRKRLWGIFTLPFEWEGEERKKRAQKALNEIRKNYRAYFILENEKIIKHYPELKMEIAMSIPAAVAKHIVIDFLRIGMKNMLHRKIRGELGAGVGFGVGKNRIKVAIEDALSSPWMGEGDKIIFLSGNVEIEDARYIVQKYLPQFWDVYTTNEYGERIKATVIEIRQESEL